MSITVDRFQILGHYANNPFDQCNFNNPCAEGTGGRTEEIESFRTKHRGLIRMLLEAWRSRVIDRLPSVVSH